MSGILHVASREKFIPPFIDFVAEHFDTREHHFIVIGFDKRYPIQAANYISQDTGGLVTRIKLYLELIWRMHSSEKVILHGLFRDYINLVLLIMPWLRKKCYWALWGGDLYQYQKPRTTLKAKFYEWVRRRVIKNMGVIVTSIRGDYDNAVKWYHSKSPNLPYFMYPASLYHEPTPLPRESDAIRILVGNSAYPTNNHFEALDKLAAYSAENVEVWVPLNYGDTGHAQKVIEYGQQLFGKKFKPITQMMAYDDYMRFLTTIDIGVFNHDRQQGMSNIRVLLGLGKKIYMRPEVSSFKTLTALGASINDIKDIDINLSAAEGEQNRNAIAGYYSVDNLKQNLERIFTHRNS